MLAGILTQLLNLSARLTAIRQLAAVGIFISGVCLNADTLANLLFIGLATAHVIRTARERRAEEQRLKSELESAQSVQALPLSQNLPAGVEAIYLSASEVSGDFYQAYSTPAGILVVVGECRAKGCRPRCVSRRLLARCAAANSMPRRSCWPS